jgi:hypothetical protein
LPIAYQIVSNWSGCVITTEGGVYLNAGKNGQIAGSDVVRYGWNVPEFIWGMCRIRSIRLKIKNSEVVELLRRLALRWLYTHKPVFRFSIPYCATPGGWR